MQLVPVCIHKAHQNTSGSVVSELTRFLVYSVVKALYFQAHMYI